MRLRALLEGLPVMERKLAAILSADVVAFSRLMEQDESGTFLQLRSCRKELIEPAIATHRGRIFKLMGDGLLAEFASVIDAVLCAVLLQRSMARRGVALPADRRLEIRIGIDVGDVIIEGDDRYGEGVNIASRLQQFANPGGICVSGTVYDQVKHKLALTFKDGGEHKVKNITEPISVYHVSGAAPRRRSALVPRGWRASRRLQVGATAVLSLCVLALLALLPWASSLRSEPDPPGPAAASRLPIVAVLPFANMSSDRELDYLADGMTTAVIGELTRSGQFRVPSRTLPPVRGQPLDVRQIGRDLGAQFVLLGSVHKGKGQLRAVAQLIDARTGDHVGGGRSDGPAGDFLAFQDQASAEIVGLVARTAGFDSDPKAVASRGPPAASAKPAQLPPTAAADPNPAGPADSEPAQIEPKRVIDPPAQPAATHPVQPAASPSRPAAPALDRALTVLIQDRLRALGYDPGPVDGRIGQRTRAVISMYQAEQGMKPDGLPSRALLDHLQRRPAAPAKQAEEQPPRVPPPDLTPAPASSPVTAPVAAPQAQPPAAALQTGSAPPGQDVPMADPSLVFLIQHRLRELGFMPSRFDGRMDAGTVEAIRAYEKNRRLPATGMPTRQLLARLEGEAAGLAPAARSRSPNVRASVACAGEGESGAACDEIRGQLVPAPSLGVPSGTSSPPN
jgi:class 3 adenylate cyclase/TolB-like protein/peptidoglycan hydrolase-like protein with peptidoglycan-binding domain